MQTVTNLLKQLQTLNVRIWAEDDRLRLNAPKGALTPELQQDLAVHKPEILAYLRGIQAANSIPALTHAAGQGRHPLSFAQKRMWILQQMEPESGAYNIPQAIRLRGNLNLEALAASFEAIVQRHAILRTTYAVVDGVPFQEVNEVRPLSFPVIDLSASAAPATEAQRLIRAEANQPFALERELPLRVSLLRLAADEHILLITINHIASDGSSFAILGRELVVLYEGFVAHQSAADILSPLSIQFTDYVVWEEKLLQSDFIAEQLAYWKEQLAGELPTLDLLPDYNRQPLRTFHGARLQKQLTPALSGSVRQFCQREGVTLFVALLAAFKLLLHRYTGQEEIIVGSPIAGRNHAELENMIGLFLNTLALRTDLSGEPSYRELVKRVREVGMGAIANQDVPFEMVLEALKLPRDASRTPLFQVFFNVLNFSRRIDDFRSLETEVIVNPELDSLFDVTLYVDESKEHIDLHLAYNTDLFSEASMANFLAQFVSLLRQVIATPDQQIGTYPLVTEAEKLVLPDPTMPLDKTWHGSVSDALSRHAAKRPQQMAVIDTTDSWSYQELNQRSNQLAHYLIEQGVQPQDVVAIYGHRSASLAWALMGIFKARAAFLILDPSYPEERLVKYLELAQPKAFLQIAAAGEPPPIVLETLPAVHCAISLTLPSLTAVHKTPFLADYPVTDLFLSVGPDDLGCLAFTSGSTGLPKGIRGRYGSLTHFLPWIVEEFRLSDTDRFSMLSGLAHDPLQRDIFTALWVGGTLCVPDPEQMMTPGWAANWLHEQGVTFANLTPAMSRVITTLSNINNKAARAIPKLRYAFFIGERLTRQDVNDLRELCPGVTAVNLYGATETQRALSYYVVPPDLNSEKSVAKDVLPLGKAMPGAQLLLLNPAGQIATVGEMAEICFRSPHLALGYLHDDAQTASRFHLNPFGATDKNDRLYFSGDMGRYLPDGNVEFVNRADDQVKIRGFRVELGEIDAMLGQHTAVHQAITVATKDAQIDSTRLSSFIVLKPNQSLTDVDLRHYLRQKLPMYMVPTDIVLLEALPLTPNGKVDRRALLVPEHVVHDTGNGFAEPQNEIEAILVQIWGKVLGVQPISIHDNFFDIGGHSLIATQIIARIEQMFNIEFALRLLFELPTISELAHAVEMAQAAQEQDGGLDVQIMPHPRTGPLPLSFSQERMWFMQQMQPQSGAYNVSMGVRLKGELHAGAMTQALNDMVQRHETLRTRYKIVEGQPVPVIEETAVLELQLFDLQDIPSAVSETNLLQQVNEFAKQPFDLEIGPIIRACLFRLSPQEHILLISVHHIATDAWSSFVFARELAHFYQMRKQNSPSALLPLPIQYVDFAMWQRRYFQGDVLQEQLNYWKNKLKDVPRLDLPTDNPRPLMQTFNGEIFEHLPPPTLMQDLHRLSQKHQVTTFMTVLAAFQVLLYRYTRQTDFAVGVPIANRQLPSVENLIGTFINMLVLRADLEGDPTFLELLQRVRQTALEAYAHQDMPFEKLIAEMPLERGLSQSPLFQVMLDYINVPEPIVQIEGFTNEYLRINRQTSKFDLGLIIVDTAQVQRLELEYNTDLFDAATVERMLGHLESLLTAVVTNPDVPISQLPLLTSGEREQLLETWNNTAVAYPHTACLHHLFEAQVARTPEKTAVIYEDQTITYAELNQRADDLAYHLQQMGVGPDVIVGLCLTRSVEMMVSLMAVLKAGGAYLPLDPAYPLDRLTYMLADAGSPVLITESSLNLADKLVAELPQQLQVCMIDQDNLSQALLSAPEKVNTSALPHNLAYVIYTSGSTGRPKGVEIPHRAAVNFLLSMQQKPGITAVDNLLSVTTLSFDIAVLELYLPLISGASVTIVPRVVAYDGRLLAEKLQQSGATIMQATPVTWRMLLDTGWAGDSNLKTLCGGEAMPPDLARELVSRCRELWNMYGPTETTVWSTIRRITPDTDPITIGRPIGNTKIYILDRHMQPVPLGVVGDLYIGGDGLARGYHERPELTAEKFIPDPFQPNSRLYSTGDLACYLPNGEIDFLGRSDFQIKIRGFRVELGEIETALMAHPAVREAVTIVREDNPGDQRLVAYLIPDETLQRPDLAELRDFVAEQLPAYMVPANFVIMESFPKTPNRKVDRKALPIPDAARQEYGRQYVAPRNPVEEVVANIMAETLSVDQVGINDNFFELGGHSLMVTRVLFRITQQFQVDIPLREFFENPTAAGLSAFLLADSSQQGRIERTAEILIKLSQLSDEEVGTMLRNKKT